MNKNLFQIFGLCLTLFMFSCCNNPVEPDPKRNILFYIGGDNNLIYETYDKINQIRKGWQPGKGEMLIYADQRGIGACLLRVNETKDTYGFYGLDTLQIYGAENSADAETLRRVINKMVIDYPADRYGMIFFSHSSGWLPEGMLNSPRSLVIDNGNGISSEMEYPDFAAAIPDKQFDFIIFEACLMAGIQPMYELRNKAEYLLASSAEIVSPGFTYTYGHSIMRLYDTKNDVRQAVTGFAQSYCDTILKYYPENNVYCSFTMSLIKTSELDNLSAVTKTVLQGAAMNETTITTSDIQSFDRLGSDAFGYQRRSRYFDLGQVVENLVSEAQYQTFNAQLEKTVVWKSASKNFLLSEYGFPIERHSGLTTYVEQSAFPALNAAFENSSWYKAIYQ